MRKRFIVSAIGLAAAGAAAAAFQMRRRKKALSLASRAVKKLRG